MIFLSRWYTDEKLWFAFLSSTAFFGVVFDKISA